jgi:hypothetical protein
MGFGIQLLIVLFVDLPPAVWDLHRKTNETTCPFLVSEDNALALGDRRGHQDGR